MSHADALPPDFGRLGRRRMRTAMLVILSLFLVICARLVYIQVFDPEGNADKLVKQSLVKQTIPAKRGEILDVNNRVLAHSVTRYDIVIDQQQINDRVAKGDSSFEREVKLANGKTGKEVVTFKKAIEDIAKVLSLQPKQVERAVTGTKQYAQIFQGATEEQMSRILAVELPGLYADRHDVRQYPEGTVAGSIVGYTNGDEALGGIELMENDVLSGRNGQKVFEIGRDGIRNPYGSNDLSPAKDGSTVKLTIDSDIQAYAQEQAASATQRLNGEWANITVLDVQTGRILASADHSTVDPNDISKHKGQYGLQPIGLVDGFEPGSTAKVVTFAGALEMGLITPTTPIDTPNRYTIGGETFKDYEDHGLWHKTAAGVLARSLNTGTVQVAQKMTPEQRYDWLKKFGVGQKIDLGFPGMQTGILDTSDKWDARKAYTVSFGQGFTQTALHTAQIYQTIANKGVRVKPQLIDSVIDPDGTVHPVAPSQGERVISENTAHELNRMMENVAVDGGGVTGQLKNYRIAVKTGTAESVGPTGQYDAYTISFAGFAPAENPRFVVVATIGRTQQITSAETGPVFAKVMERLMTKYRVPPSTTKPDLYPTFSDGTPNEGSQH